MQVSSALANGLWAASALPVWARYRRWLADPARQQAARLACYIRDNRDTAFGRAHGFDRIDSMRAYQARVPIRTYDELSPFIDRIVTGEAHVLTREAVRRLAFTSGSTAGAKLVPYTRTLTQELTRGAAVWIADLFRANPSLAGGPAYWSITPIGQRQRRLSIAAAAKIPVGFDDDTAYLGPIARRLASAALAVPSDVGAIEDLDTCRYVTLQCLLRATDLRLVSVWHPSFLTLLLDAMDSWWPALLDDLARGTLTPPSSSSSPLPAALAARLRVHLPANPRRAAALARIGPRDVRAIWPALALVSCWTDGPARLHAADLERRLSGIRVQGKGLVATEAFVTVPLGEDDGGARPLALPCHVFELLGEDGRVVLPHDTELDAVYTIIVTTGGGLYRYRLQDRVRVTGFVGRTPSLTFLGKEDAISDLVGEKLSEGFVTAVVQQVCAAHGLTPRFALLAPEDHEPRAAYTLFLDVDAGAAAASAPIAATLDTRLRENPHYAYAVDLGQLAPARVVFVDRGAQAAYLARRAADGLRVGDIKPASLSPQRGWAAVLMERS